MRSIVEVHEVLLKSAMFVVSWPENKCEKSTYLGFVSTNEPSNNPGEQSVVIRASSLIFLSVTFCCFLPFEVWTCNWQFCPSWPERSKGNINIRLLSFDIVKPWRRNQTQVLKCELAYKVKLVLGGQTESQVS